MTDYEKGITDAWRLANEIVNNYKVVSVKRELRTIDPIATMAAKNTPIGTVLRSVTDDSKIGFLAGIVDSRVYVMHIIEKDIPVISNYTYLNFKDKWIVTNEHNNWFAMIFNNMTKGLRQEDDN